RYVPTSSLSAFPQLCSSVRVSVKPYETRSACVRVLFYPEPGRLQQLQSLTEQARRQRGFFSLVFPDVVSVVVVAILLYLRCLHTNYGRQAFENRSPRLATVGRAKQFSTTR